MILSERGEAIVTLRWKTPGERRSKIRMRWISAANDAEVTKGNQQQGKRKRLREAARLGQPQINENTTNDRGGGSRSSKKYTRQMVRSADAKKKEVKRGYLRNGGRGVRKRQGNKGTHNR
jgi:hypothetical protein